MVTCVCDVIVVLDTKYSFEWINTVYGLNSEWTVIKVVEHASIGAHSKSNDNSGVGNIGS